MVDPVGEKKTSLI